MKKLILALLVVLPLLNACQNEEKLEGHSGDMEDGYGLNEKELAEINMIKNELIAEIKKGDSITVLHLHNEIDSLKMEIHKLKDKK